MQVDIAPQDFFTCIVHLAWTGEVRSHALSNTYDLACSGNRTGLLKGKESKEFRGRSNFLSVASDNNSTCLLYAHTFLPS